eukprot:TRINITY_DN23106_c0_g1_i1.p1 TRINITY_DN23106_c0_g1~~TRINITY_DN23106_c0_g1_i1.p1  ORF type:complete len:102 (-),score=3.79 TRINITY_DN23106_c0_g1_i1:66-371(-)
MRPSQHRYFIATQSQMKPVPNKTQHAEVGIQPVVFCLLRLTNSIITPILLVGVGGRNDTYLDRDELLRSGKTELREPEKGRRKAWVRAPGCHEPKALRCLS